MIASRSSLTVGIPYRWFLSEAIVMGKLVAGLSLLLAWCSISLAHAGGEPRPSNVGIAMTDEMGPLFVNEAGFTLYTSRYDDRANISKCNADRYERVLGRGQAVNILPDPETRPTCEQAWPPFRPASEDVTESVGHWRVITRHDGSVQWAYKGQPVYLSSYDQIPAQLTERGTFLGRTPLFVPRGLPVGMDGRLTSAGFTLTNTGGYTLYSTDEQCDRECEKVWRPFNVPVAVVLDKEDKRLSFAMRSDGSRQWAHEGNRLYTYAGDLAPGEVNGQDEEGWDPVILYPRQEPPEDITVQMSGDGEAFADRNGMTVYAFYCSDEAPDHLPCDRPGAPEAYRLSICGSPDVCMATWRPVVASSGAKQVGNVWTIVPVDPTGERLFAREDGDIEPLMVWAYHGRPVFTYAHDKVPGDIVGDKVSHLVDWGFWMLKR